MLGEVLQGWMPGNLQTPFPCVINPLPALMGALASSRVRSGQEFQGCETLRLGKWQSTVPLLWDVAGQPVPYHRPSSFRVLQVRGRNQNSGYYSGSGYFPHLTKQHPTYV